MSEWIVVEEGEEEEDVRIYSSGACASVEDTRLAYRMESFSN